MNALLIKSLNLGIIDTALTWLIGAITTLLMWIVEWTLDLILLIFADLFYELGLTLLNFVDFFQAFFNALCGMGTYWDSKGVIHEQEDPIISLITNEAVLQVFLALCVVAVVLLFMTTLVAMVRTEFNSEGAKNTKGNIIGQALKSLFMFFLVPAACVFGIIFSSALLNMVYIATSGGSNVSAGGMVWYASSYNANRLRTDSLPVGVSGDGTVFEIYKKNGYLNDFGGNNAEDKEVVANAIDNAFKTGVPVNDAPQDIKDRAKYAGQYSLVDLIHGVEQDGNGKYSYTNTSITEAYYSTRDMNFIIMFLGGGIALYIMFIAAFGLIIRLYKCAILFLVSAPISALTPLDGGQTFKSWRKLMLGSVCSAFAVVIAFNLVFLLIPIMSEINIFNPNNDMLTAWNRLVNMLFVLTGLYSIKETSKWVASMLGIEDPLAAGSEIAGKVMGTVGKIGAVAGGLAVSAVGKTAAKIAAAKSNKDGEALSEKMAGVEGAGHDAENKALGAENEQYIERDKDGNIARNADGSIKFKKNGAGVELSADKQKELSEKLNTARDTAKNEAYGNLSEDEKKGIQSARARLESSTKVAGAFGRFGDAATNVGVGTIKKTLGGKLQKLDDFMGGTKLLGGYDDEGNVTGLGGLAVKGATNLYSGASTAVGTVAGGTMYSVGSGLVRGVGGAIQGASLTAGTAAAGGANQETATGMAVLGGLAGGFTEGFKGFGEGFKHSFIKTGAGPWGGAHGQSAGATLLAGIRESEANMKKMYEMASQASKEVERLIKTLTDGLRRMGEDAFKRDKNGRRVGLSDAAYGQYGDQLARLGQLTGTELKVNQIAAKLVNGDTHDVTAKELQNSVDKNVAELGKFYNANINMGGIHVEMMNGDLKEALQQVFSGLNIEGSTLEEQMSKVTSEVKKEIEKQNAELKKQQKMISQLAVAIAKYGKRLNPGK